MSFGFPFPSDKLAMARMDFCATPNSVILDANPDFLSCNLRARQCGSYINSTQDHKWASTAGPSLHQIVGPAVIERWGGTKDCVSAETSGVCNLLSTFEPDSYQDELWTTFGRPRAINLYEQIEGGVHKQLPKIAPLGPRNFATRSWMAANYK
jgi:hypothetical protein